MNNTNKRLSVVAYYLSKYDMEAVRALGFRTRSEAISTLSGMLGNGNNYLKLRRDEFDVLTGSSRKGYRNREPARAVLEMHKSLEAISFSDFTAIIKGLTSRPIYSSSLDEIGQQIRSGEITESDIEEWVNATDVNAARVKKLSERFERVYDKKIIENLKNLYQHKCQICQHSFIEIGASVVEAHHIEPFAESENNNASNIIILCPNHHKLLHKATVMFDREHELFRFSNGYQLHVTLNLHL